jgi:hypothetical protein
MDVDHSRETLFHGIILIMLNRCFSQLADLSAGMKQNSFQCQRREHLFIPVQQLPIARTSCVWLAA